MSIVDSITDLAESQVGYHEGRSSGGWDNDQKYSREVPGLAWSNYQAWCCTFACWLFWKTGNVGLLPFAPTASCDVAMAGWKKSGQWSETPTVGAQVFFGHPGDAQHTGYVTRFDATRVWSIEGNTNATGSYQGDGVYAKTHARRDPRVLGYGHPNYPTDHQPIPPKETPVTLKRNNVELARFRIQQALDALTDAVDGGRKAAVATARDDLRKVRDELPEK